MKVGFVARKRNFEVLPSQIGRGGYSVQHLTSTLYTHLLKNAPSDISIDKVTFGATESTFVQRATMIGELLYRDMRKYDIIHANAPLPMKPWRMKKDGILIETSHGIRSIDKEKSCYYVERRSRNFWEAVMSSVVERHILSVDFIIAVSTLTKKRLVDLGFESKRIFVVNNGLDERFLQPIPKKKPRKYFTVGYLGPFYYSKNLIFAINAFKKTKDRNMRFEIWGRQAYEYPNLLAAASSDKRIRFMGMAPEARLVDVYDSFDAFVFPTLCDVFGLPIIEAESRGLPVITFKGGEISEETRKYTIGAEDEEHMAAILEDLKANGYAEELRHKSTEYARSFTADRQAIETLKVYEKVYGK